MAAGAIAPLQFLCNFKSDDLLPDFKLFLDVETHYPKGKKQKPVHYGLKTDLWKHTA